MGRVAEHGRDLMVDRLSQLLVNQVECPVRSASDGAKQRIQVIGRGVRARAPALLPTHERYSKAPAVRLASCRALSTTMTITSTARYSLVKRS